jgi:hypothetical protein
MEAAQQDGVSDGDGVSVGDVPGTGGRLGMDVSELVVPEPGGESEGDPESGGDEDDGAQVDVDEDGLDDAVLDLDAVPLDDECGAVDLVCDGVVFAVLGGEFDAGGPGFTGGSGGVVRGGLGGRGPTGTTIPTPAA